ncbi:MAG TPA: TlpA disulfide reductase family protein [Azospirillum sp.]|nr:TlpA disulfide reductase family protein [Azospirillum sp.]
MGIRPHHHDSMRRRHVLGGLAAGAALLIAGCGEEPAPGAVTLPPGLRLARLFEDGEDRLSDFAGRPLVINFWATWCAPCRAEMPSLERLSVRLAARGVLLIGASVDANPFPVREYLRERGLTFARHFDAGRDAARQLGIAEYPTTLILDAAGRLKSRMIGAADWEDPALVATLGRMLGVRLAA